MMIKCYHMYTTDSDRKNFQVLHVNYIACIASAFAEFLFVDCLQ
jgi:hypothetical protein